MNDDPISSVWGVPASCWPYDGQCERHFACDCEWHICDRRRQVRVFSQRKLEELAWGEALYQAKAQLLTESGVRPLCKTVPIRKAK